MNGECIYILEGHTDSINAIAYIFNTRYIVSGSSDNSMKIWDY